MGAIGGLLGTAGGAAGTGFSTPQTAPITAPVTQDQVNAGQTGVSGSLGSSNSLLAALQGQGGVANQGQVYNQGQSLAGQLGGVNGTGALGSAMAGQGALNGQLAGAGGVGLQAAGAQGLLGVLQQQQGIANGTGPNPALAQLNQATGANVANQAALMAGQRGAGANVGLLARQAGQQGAATQQQAAGQAATLQAQQQLNALGAMTGTNQALAGIGSGLTSQQQAGLGAQTAQGTGAVGLQQAQLAQNAGIAQNQVGNLAGATQTNLQGNLTNAGQLIGAQGQFNTTQAGQQASVNSGNTALANTTQQGQQGLIGGLLNSAGAGSSMAGKTGAGGAGALAAGAEGGLVQRFDQGGQVQGPQSSFGQFLQGWGANMTGQSPQATPMAAMGDQTAGSRALSQGATSARNGLIAALTPSADPGTTYSGQPMVSPATQPGSIESTGSATGDYLGGGTSTAGYLGMASGGLAAGGGGVKASAPGQKAVKSGNSYDNDKVPAMLSEGEVVIPRSVMQSKDPAAGAAKFVAALMAKKGKAS